MEKVKTNNRSNYLNKKVWETLVEHYFGWDTYHEFKRTNEKFPKEFWDMIDFAKSFKIETVEKAKQLCDNFVIPFKREAKVEVYGIVEIDGLKVPTTCTDTDTKKVSRTRNGKSKAKRVLSADERIQNYLAQYVWKVRDANFKLAVSDLNKFEELSKNAFEAWKELFLKLNDNSNIAKLTLTKLHYPKAKMYYWKTRNA